MKRFLFLLIVVFFPLQASYAQLGIIGDSVIANILEDTKLEYLVQYGDMIKEAKNQVTQLKDQLANTVKQVDMAARNIRSAKDINSWDDFMDWYNRQLYYEKMTVESVKGMNVSIGKKNYSLWDLESIRDGFQDTYIDYWDKEFTEEQRREMWLGLGLSPANYAYVQPYREKGREVSRQLFAMSEIQNRKNIESSKENKKAKDKIAKDAEKPEDKQMGDKEIQTEILDATLRGNEALNDLTYIEAKRAEREGINDALDAPLHKTQNISGWLTKRLGFGEPLRK